MIGIGRVLARLGLSPSKNKESMKAYSKSGNTEQVQLELFGLQRSYHAYNCPWYELWMDGITLDELLGVPGVAKAEKGSGKAEFHFWLDPRFSEKDVRHNLRTFIRQKQGK